MPLLTTTIGSYPKPDDTPVPGWFAIRDRHRTNPTEAYSAFLRNMPEGAPAALDRATEEVVREQAAIGIDVPTDGEVRREHYIYYHLRRLQGFDFDRLSVKVMRGGTWQAEIPTVVGPLAAGPGFLVRDWRTAQGVTDRRVKITVPGPLTIMDSTADAHYGDERKLAFALADALNVEIRRLAEAGCSWIQVDEPVFARKPDRALDYGVEALGRCFAGVTAPVNRVVHICCGYPSELDQEDYPKADQQSYFALADALEAAPIDAVSLEDAHRHNDLKLLERFRSTKVILGVVGIARTRIEPVEEIRARLTQALEHIDAERLIAGPDCGLIMLERPTAMAKLANLVAAAQSLA
ncbi:MAG: cobalamin-independent methionine synthase II family protein [Proteobacteria bacterium]|nr:cobalamin-independent methionine synthase II family protein [Pseudomonadota bacterium]